MSKVVFSFGLALFALLLTVAPAVAQTGGPFTLVDGPVTNLAVLTYDPATGHVSYDGNGTMITTFELVSKSSQFVVDGANAGVVVPPFDLINAGKFFKMTATGIASVDVGTILPAGLTGPALVEDLVVDGSILPRGKLTDTGVAGYEGQVGLYVVPEPSSLALVGLGLIGLMGLRRRGY